MTDFKKLCDEIQKAALAYPGAYAESPWGHIAIKVKGKVFVFLGDDGESFGLSVKLPRSNALALSFPFAEPTHYGMGKYGWVSARFKKGDDVPTGLLLEWLDESSRAIAPKKLVTELDGAAPPKAEEKKTKKPAGKKKKSAGTVLVVSDDKLRFERAKKAIGEEGLGSALGVGVEDAFELAAKKKPRAVIVDLGRSAPAALEVGIQLAHALGKTPVVFAGARDAATQKKARKSAPGVRAALREPPGDPAVVAELSSILG